MSLIFEALQRLERRRNGVIVAPRPDADELLQHIERRPVPQWEAAPEEPAVEVYLNEPVQPSRFAGFAEMSQAHPGPEIVSPAASSEETASEPQIEPKPTSDTTPAYSATAEKPSTPADALPSQAVASYTPPSQGYPRTDMQEIPYEPAPETRLAVAPVPSRQPASPPVAAPPPARPAADLKRIKDGLAVLKVQRRELRELGLERGASIKRVEDRLARVSHSSERNTLEQQGLLKDIRRIGRTIGVLAMTGLCLMTVSVAVTLALLLRIMKVLP